MNISDAIQARKSVRAFLDRPVPRERIEAILDTARWAPSGVNTQPWKVVVLAGQKKQELQQRIITHFTTHGPGRMDFSYYPEQWQEPYVSRRRECGMALYGALAIRRDDRERRLQQWIANYRAFDAPVMLMFTMDRQLQTGSYMDYGMFLQSVMLAALDHGLTTCPQAALGEFPDIVRDCLGLDEDQVIISGMALGYEDTHAPVNRYRTVREPVEAFTTWMTGER
ncbi:MAG: nitroreductase [Thiothrix sp.]|nr:nitroreductase [Thiothrix sp.]HPE58970.1 nitroreductase [Thiolinea sp.]